MSKTAEGKKPLGKRLWDASYKVSDKIAVYANGASAKVGGEAFWPSAGDTQKEIEKCARILQTFTRVGVPETITKEKVDQNTGQKVKKEQRVLKKIPASAIRQAKGIVIYTAFRTAIAPFGGAGGSGIMMARLPDGSWSAPVGVMPNNLSAGFMWGLDIYDVVLILRTEKAVQSFYSHKFTLGGEVTVTAGPVGAGAMLETGREMVPCWSYVKSRGFYAGVELNGTIIVMRTDEAARFYYKREIKAEQILTGGVHMPHEARPLHNALLDAESRSDTYAAGADEVDGIEIPEDFELEDGETLKLPPTPEMLAQEEPTGFRESWLQSEKRQKEAVPDVVYDTEEDRAFARRPPPTRLVGKATPPLASGSSSPALPPSLPPRKLDDAPSLPERPIEDTPAPPPYNNSIAPPEVAEEPLIDVKRPIPETHDSETSLHSISGITDTSSVYSVDTEGASRIANDGSIYEDNDVLSREQEEHDSEMIKRLTLDQPILQETPVLAPETPVVVPESSILPPPPPPRRRAVPPPLETESSLT